MSSSDSSIVSVRDMIEMAFGYPEKNVVDHKMIQAILYLLARQLRVLERRVKVEIYQDYNVSLSATSLSVSEVKLQANVPKKNRHMSESQKGAATPGGQKGVGVSGGAAKPGGDTLALGGKARSAPGDQSESSDKSTSDRSDTEKTKSSTYEKTTTSTDKTTTLSSSGRTTTDKTSSGGKTTSSGGKTTSSGGKTTISMDKTTTSTDKTTTSADKTTTSADKTTTSADKTTTSSSGKGTTSTDKTTSSSGKGTTSTDKTTSSSGKGTTSTDRTTTSTDKTTTSTDKSTTSAGKTTTSTGKTTTSSDKTKTTSSSSGKEYFMLLDSIEVNREKELRVIRQVHILRTDSHEERDRSPTPMASMDSVEIRQENLLVVERVPSGEARGKGKGAGGIHGETHGRTPRLSIVTQEDFVKLVKAVRELQTRFGSPSMPDFPENLQLMAELRKGASLTDAMAALQLSARLEAAEKALGRMIGLVTELAKKTPGVDMSNIPESLPTEVLFGGPGTKSHGSQPKPVTHTTKEYKSRVAVERSSSEESYVTPTHHAPGGGGGGVQPSHGAGGPALSVDDDKHYVTPIELDSAMDIMYDDLNKMLIEITYKTKSNADNALKIASRLETRLNASLNLGDRMGNLEKIVSEYAEQINILDTGLSSQMTNYQETLTQMQHDLECGMEAMAEALASAGGDTTAVAELNKRFTDLQMDFESTHSRQNDLKDILTALNLDLQNLWKEVEILRATKSDRDEVADALRDKAGIEALNGLVSAQQFDAVRGDFEKQIGAAYDKFNNQEIVWQKAIDELVRELSAKADWVQVLMLREDINSHLKKLKNRIQSMLDIVGEPEAAAISKRLHREAACLSCSTPAHMALEEAAIVPDLPSFPRPPTLGAESISKPKEDGDHGICYPGLPLPHPRDPRAHVCNRYCGGSHTIVPNTLTRVPPGMIVNTMNKTIATDVGTDGKTYRTDDVEVKRPCTPCNKPKSEIPPTQEQGGAADDSLIISSEFQTGVDNFSGTPPVPIDDF